MRDSRILEFLTTMAWALHQPILEKLSAIVHRHASGVKLDATDLETYQLGAIDYRAARREQESTAQLEAGGAIAVVPIRGVISRHAAGVDDISAPSGTSVDEIKAGIEQAIGDSRVHTILLHVDSPGGAVEGITEVTDAIARARETKRVVALADGSMASLAYWIASQAHALYTTPTSAVGSIGVYSVVADTSGVADAAGVKVHMVKAGEHKGTGEPGVPISKTQLAGIQENVDAFYDLFTTAVAEGRGITKKRAVALADGRVHIGAGAVGLGLADRVASFPETIEALTEPPAPLDEEGVEAKTTPEAPGYSTGRCNWPGRARSFRDFPLDPTQAAAAAPTDEDREMTKPKTATLPPAAAEPEVITDPPTTLAELQATFPDQVAALKLEAQAEERARIEYINAQACEFQADLAAELVTTGASQDQALRRLHTDLMDNGPARAEELVTADPLGTVDEDPDGGAATGPRAWNERTGSWEDGATSGPDYAACTDEAAVTEMAKAEFAALDKGRQKDLGGLRAFAALRRGEFHERQAAAG